MLITMKEKHTAPEIKQLRKQLELSQSEFALLVGISVDSVRRWEQGFNYNPTKRTAKKLAKLVKTINASLTLKSK